VENGSKVKSFPIVGNFFLEWKMGAK